MKFRPYIVMIGGMSLLALMMSGSEARAESAWPDAYNRRVFQLGITLSEFRNTKHPDQEEWPNAYPVCSNDEEFKKINRFGNAFIGSVWNLAGVIKCEHYWKHESTVSRLSKSLDRTQNGHSVTSYSLLGAGLMLGDIPSSTTYYFYPPTENDEPVLFSMETLGPSEYFANVISLFKIALGPPKKSMNEKRRNRFGHLYSRYNIVYSNDISHIKISQNADTAKKFKIEHVLEPVSDQLSKKLDAYQRKQSKKL